MPVLYHERQIAALCGQHCLNNLLQGPYFTEDALAELALELDAREEALMLSEGVTADARRFLDAPSGNVDESGNFSIQVLSEALKRSHGLTLEDARTDSGRALLRDPSSQLGFVLNRSSHWYCLRKLEGVWWRLNSSEANPERLSQPDLVNSLAHLSDANWSIFVVHEEPGSFPMPMLRDPADAEHWVDTAKPRGESSRFGGTMSGPLRPPSPKFAPFSGAGNTLGGGGGVATGTAAAAAAASDAGGEDAQLALALAMSRDLAGVERLKTRLPAQPADGAAAARVALRLPDGSRLSRRFPPHSSVQSLVDVVCIALAEGAVGSGSYEMRSQHPPFKLCFTSDAKGDQKCEGGLTIEEAGLCPSAQLHISAI